ncbi:DUF2441 domain-containing protein [Sutcliffiella cohnii]
MLTFYHTSNHHFKPGEIINPTYGIKILNPNTYFNNDHLYSQYLKECIFEDYREAHFPNQPSRLTSVYLLDDLNSAIQYQRKFNKSFIYQVSVVSSGKLMHADMRWLDLAIYKPIDQLIEIANYYFSGKPVDKESFIEVLFEGTVSVTRKLDRK